MNDNDDPYGILGVSKDATDDDIKKAYRKLALKYHPDRYSGSTVDEQKKAADTFAKISAANEILSDEEERWQYEMRKKNGGKVGTRYVRPNSSNGNQCDTTFYDNNASDSDFNWTTPSYSKTYTTKNTDPTSCCSGTKTRETLGPYKVTKTTFDSNGVPRTTTYYSNEPPQDSPTKVKRSVNVSTTKQSPSRKSTTINTSKISTPTSPYKITRTTFDSNGVPKTTTFYSDQPPSENTATTSTPVRKVSKSTVKSCPNPSSTRSSTTTGSPYKVTKTVYDENGVPTTTTFITDKPPTEGNKTILPTRAVNSLNCTNSSPEYIRSPTKTKLVSSSTSCPMKQDQQTLTSSSSKIIQNADGSTDVITTTLTKLSDGTIRHQSNSTQRFPPGVTPALNNVIGSTPLSVKKTTTSTVATKSKVPSTTPVKNKNSTVTSVSSTKKKTLK